MIRFLNHKGTTLILRFCKETGCKLPAVFGRDVDMQLTARLLAKGNIEGARTAAGIWACEVHV